MRIPKSLAAVADLYYATREKRLAMEKEAAAVQAQEGELREYLINNLPKSMAGGIQGKLARVEVKTKEVPQLENRDKFFKFAMRKGNEDLVSMRMNDKAVKARWENKKTVPGVSVFKAVTLSVHKVKGGK